SRSIPARTRPQLPAAFRAWQAEIRRQLHVPDQLPPLHTRVWSTFAPTPGVLADRITYQTADGMLVPAIVYRPEHWPGQGRTRLPGLVIVNGHGGDKYSWYAFLSGMLFARAGAVVVTYDPIGEGERNIDRKSRTGAHDLIQNPPAGQDPDRFHADWGQRLAGLMQVDLMQAVSLLRSLPQVDSARIGIAGYSMGAFVSGIEGAIDPRVHAILLSGGGTFDDAADGGKSFDTSALPCQGPPWRALRTLGDGPDERGAILYALNSARGPLFVENGSLDTVMDIPHRGPEWFANIYAQARTIDQRNGVDPESLFTTHVDPGMSHRTAWVERTGVEWLNSVLHFPRWTTEQVASMPTTHVSEWIRANHVDISPNYLREDREGGLQAVGSGYPALSRENLTVLPEASWLAYKNRLTYEGWAQKVLDTASKN
ncbi:MAG: alpha/beta hydrolase family protein, partial [Janthinobacterium lividum]